MFPANVQNRGKVKNIIINICLNKERKVTKDLNFALP